ncbi:mannonate dehydratase, partial [Bacillus altitudinis]|uniref:mannonate dehydratase n=1 Tax=Bacillus altitudinis TaxID=293387 RepID=UPI003B529068
MPHLKPQIERHDLPFQLLQTLPLHQHINLPKPTPHLYIHHYQQNIPTLPTHPLNVISYNFIPLLDSTPTHLHFPLPHQSTTLLYFHHQL